jgi:dihydroorotate dehydrogenase
MTLYRRLARPILFRLGGGDAETAHELTLRSLAAISRRPAAVRALAVLTRATARSPRTVFGPRFLGPVGIAAGLDKDGRALPAWPALGFGFVEVGTVTARAQPGNDRPRLFRLRESEAIINRMGFNNAGAAALAARLDRVGLIGVPLGISLGKSKATPLEEAIDDYLTSLRALAPYGDYFAINVSSPNTPGLRSLQDRAHLTALLAALRAETAKPILVKLAPDLSQQAIEEAVEVCVDGGAAGIIATNTTLSRNGLAPAEKAVAEQAGGLSGRPLAARSREVVAVISKLTDGRMPIVGVGGLSGPDDAMAMIDAGASLVQLYTGLIYQGPGLLRAINRALAHRPVVAA